MSEVPKAYITNLAEYRKYRSHDISPDLSRIGASRAIDLGTAVEIGDGKNITPENVTRFPSDPNHVENTIHIINPPFMRVLREREGTLLNFVYRELRGWPLEELAMEEVAESTNVLPISMVEFLKRKVNTVFSSIRERSTKSQYESKILFLHPREKS